MEHPSIRPPEAAAPILLGVAAIEPVQVSSVPSSSAGVPEVPNSSAAGGAQSSPTRTVEKKNALIQKESSASHAKESIVNRDVTDLKAIRGISNKHRAFLLKAGFTTTTEVLFTPLKPLSDRLKLSESECRDLVQAIVNERSKRWIQEGMSQSVAEQLRVFRASATEQDASQQSSVPIPPTLRFEDEGFRDLLGDGLVPGTLTEVAGEASSGKTAFSLQLSLRVQLDVQKGGLAGSCAYLSSEGNFPSTRLRDMAFKLSDGSANGIKTFMDNVHLVHCPEVDELLHVVRYSLPAMVEQSQSSYVPPRGALKMFSKPVKLVVVDSIAAPFRGSEGGNSKGPTTEEDINKSANTSLMERNAALQEISFRLRKLARQYSIVILLVNQVSDVFHKDNDRYSGSQAHPSSQAGIVVGNKNVTHENGGIPLDYRNYKHASRFFTGEEADIRNPKIAVFGLTWSNCIDLRIMLSRTGRRRRKEDGIEILPQFIIRDEQGMEIEDSLYTLETEEIRRATLIFSPFIEKGYVDYALRQEGLVSVSQYHSTPRAPPPLKQNQKSKFLKNGVNISVRKGKNKAMHIPNLTGSIANEDEYEDSDDEEEALWADMPLDDATLSQL